MADEHARTAHRSTASIHIRRWATVLLTVIVVAVLWHHVFAMTGLLWWDASPLDRSVERPAPPDIPKYDTGWVDVDTYLRTHPVWQG